MDRNYNIRNNNLMLAQVSLLIAIEAIIAFTPLGSLPIGPAVVATLGHIPVIIAAIVLGHRAGILLGATFGIFSLVIWTLIPPNPLTAFVFTPFYTAGPFRGNFMSLVICIVPRVLIGVVTASSFKALSKKSNWLAYVLSAILGSAVNTILVLGGIYFFFADQYTQAIGEAYGVMLTLIKLSILTNGIPEAIIAAIIAVAVCKPLRRFMAVKKS